MITSEEKFMFDLHGYLVIKNVLSGKELTELNTIASGKFDSSDPNRAIREDKISLWGDPFVTLIDHPRIIPYLTELIDPKFRVDHDYCLFMSKGDARGGLHGGPSLVGDHWYSYRDGEMRNGLCVVTFFLTDAPQGAGGFACIPGSHKSNFSKTLSEDVKQFERSADYVVQPSVKAGDALFFTEALIHGTMPWKADHERRALLYKYSPGNSTWAKEYYDLSAYPTLTARQKRIMSPPSSWTTRETVVDQ